VHRRPDEALLVLRASAGDRPALEALLQQASPALHRYAASLAGAQDADDILQDTLIQICRKLPWLEQPERFRAWSYRIASRLAFRHLRRQRRVTTVAMEDALVAEIEASPPAMDEAALDHLLEHAALSPASRAVLLLHFREEMPLSEMAAVLEIPLGTVKSRLAFGLKTLRTHARRP
jgi:RNA polymerase sigma-70 factor (ECF subfamily)